MDNETSFSKKLQEILEKEAFESLDLNAYSQDWESLQEYDRILLGKLLIKKGEAELRKGNPIFQESFALAEIVAPLNATILYLKGKAFVSQTQNARCLSAALEAFEKAIAVDPHFFEIYLLWGETLIYCGLFHQSPRYFQKAQAKFQEAFPFLEHHSTELESRYFWKWGLSWHLMGMTSEEPVDFHQAIQKYRQAQQLGQNSADFWQDFAEALMELSELIKQNDLCIEAVDYYHRSVCEDMENYDRWFRLASCHEKLYDMEGLLQNFELALAAFDVAARSPEPNFFLWVRWGKLYLNASKLQKNNQYAGFSIEKFKRASEMEGDHPILLGLWGEAEMIHGIHSEKLDLLRSAEQKIIRSLKQIPSNPHIWALYGTCLNELGRYFSDESYYVKAVEKFQHGLSLNGHDPLLWYGLAIAYYSLGEYWGDSQQVENAVQAYQKVFEFGGQQYPQFWNDWGLSLMKLAELTSHKAYLEAAIQKFEQIIHIQDGHIPQNHYEPEWLYNYGCGLDFLGDFTEDVSYYEKSVTVLSKALQLDPNYSHARYNLAVTLTHLGEAVADLDVLHSAIEHFQIILNEDPEDEVAWNDCGLALLNIAELVHETTHPERSQIYYDEAEQKFNHALGLGCTYSFYNLACLHSLLHSYSTAMHYLERAEMAGTLPALDDMLHDEWLENLVETPNFRQFISQISSKNNFLEG
jgi:tetratricopeptide (TPR) repeat protein